MSLRKDFWERPLARYGIAVGAVIVAVLLRLLLSGLLGSKAAFVTFYPAVMLVATLCGFRAGVLATALAGLAADYWVLPPVGRFAIASPADAISLAVFVFMGVFMSSVAGLYHRARSKSAEYEIELARRESEAKYRELVENANSAIIRYKRDGTVTYINEYALRLFGYSEEEVIGKSVMMFVPEVDSSGVDLKALADDVVSNPDAYVNNVNENVLRDGTRVWMTWTNKPIFDEHGQVVEMLTVGSNITEQKRAAEKLASMQLCSKNRLSFLTLPTCL